MSIKDFLLRVSNVTILLSNRQQPSDSSASSNSHLLYPPFLNHRQFNNLSPVCLIIFQYCFSLHHHCHHFRTSNFMISRCIDETANQTGNRWNRLNKANKVRPRRLGRRLRYMSRTEDNGLVIRLPWIWFGERFLLGEGQSFSRRSRLVWMFRGLRMKSFRGWWIQFRESQILGSDEWRGAWDIGWLH